MADELKRRVCDFLLQCGRWYPSRLNKRKAHMLVGDLWNEIEHLRGLRADKDYISWKADYNRGHLSYAGQIADREARRG